MSFICPSLRLGALLTALASAACSGSPAGAAAPSPLPTQPAALSLTCAVGTADCSSVMLGQTLTFTAQRGGAAAVASAALDFGDGAGPLELGGLTVPAQASHEYNALGTFTARLVATTVTGENRTATQTIEVGTLVTASIGATDLGGLNVLATAEVRGAAVVRYEWAFDPFGPSGAVIVTTEPQARFTYPAPGYKAVEMRALLADGRTIKASSHVVVE